MPSDREALAYLDALVADGRLDEGTLDAFEDMRAKVRRGRLLSPKQVEWVRDVAVRLELDVDVPTGPTFASGAIPRGRDVAIPNVLRVLPMSPPSRRRP